MACTGAPPRWPQIQHTRWPAADRTRAPPNQPHQRHTQGAGWAGARARHPSSPTAVMAGPHSSQPGGQSLPQTQLQQDGTHTHTRDPLGRPAQATREAVPRAPQDTSSPFRRDRETQQLHLVHRNKHGEAAKVGGQGNVSQMTEQDKSPGKEMKWRQNRVYYFTLKMGTNNTLLSQGNT